MLIHPTHASPVHHPAVTVPPHLQPVPLVPVAHIYIKTAVFPIVRLILGTRITTRLGHVSKLVVHHCVLPVLAQQYAHHARLEVICTNHPVLADVQHKHIHLEIIACLADTIA